MQNKKLLFFGKLPPPFTGENVVSESILNLLKERFEITVINSSGTVDKKNGFANKLKYFSNQFMHLARSFAGLRKAVKHQRFDIVYFSGSSSLSGGLSDSLLVKAVRDHAPRIICHLHRGNYKDNFTNRRLFNAGVYLSNNIDTFIFLSNKLSRDLDGLIAPSKRAVLPNPVDKAVLLTDAEFEEKLAGRAAEGKIIITYLSNFILSKGYMEIVQALHLLPPHVKDNITVRFIGAWVDAGPQRDAFFQEVQKQEISAAVEYIGPVTDRKRIKQLLTESDVFCLPSYYPVEAQPVSIIEAMNAGNAIISTNHASIPEYVADGQTGFLIEKNNTRQLADAIDKICDRALLQQFARHARAQFLNRFDESIVKAKLMEIFF